MTIGKVRSAAFRIKAEIAGLRHPRSSTRALIFVAMRSTSRELLAAALRS